MVFQGFSGQSLKTWNIFSVISLDFFFSGMIRHLNSSKIEKYAQLLQEHLCSYSPQHGEL